MSFLKVTNDKDFPETKLPYASNNRDYLVRQPVLGNEFLGNFPENLYFNIGAITIFNFNHFMPN